MDTTTAGQPINQLTHEVDLARLPDKDLKLLVDLMSKMAVKGDK